MPDLIVSSDIDALLQSANTASARTNLELGSTDTVEFGALETSQFNFPDLTTSELNAVTDAIEGDTYFDSDRSQLVRFTGASSYDVITSRSYEPVINTTQGAALTLQESRLFESGLFPVTTNIASIQARWEIGTAKDPSSWAPTPYMYYGDTFNNWLDASNPVGPITAAVFTPDTLMQFKPTVGNRSPLVWNNYITNTTTPVELVSSALKSGSTYEFEFQVNYLDLALDNAKLSVLFSGLYEDSGYLRAINLDTETGLSLLDVSINAPEESSVFTMGETTFAANSGSNFGSWIVRGVLTPSSDGTLSFKLAQNQANIDHLFYSVPTMKITLLTD